jgi:glucose-6-phosphate isomerase/transaldolase/glucose-6-phosphate isomerase
MARASTSGRTEPLSALRGDESIARGTKDALDALQASNIVARIAEGDHTVWRDDPTEIVDRLGWLTVADGMRAAVSGIREFAEGLAAEGVEDVALLGMGGSSLAPEVLRRTFGSAPGFPRLHVLDTTSPAWIRRVTGSFRPELGHAIVASKSGSTIEVRTLFAHFESVAAEAGEEPGKRFTAITDPGTELDALAEAKGFRRTFRNPPDIGGRYSALSFFGLVPGGVLGVDIMGLLDRARAMAAQCEPGVAAASNPGALLGALLGAAALAGRDKLSILLSPGISSFGLWVEQLVAESTGKEGRGIVPVVDEPVASASCYGRDRLFVALRLHGDDNETLDRQIDSLVTSGQPVYTIDVPDRLALGAEIFRWELATAIAGHLLGIQPFDQPDVQSAKTLTSEILDALTHGEARPEADSGDPVALLDEVREGDFVGIMIYGDPDEEIERAVNELRRALQESRRVATTYGIGPRFLHSTGQLHKGYSNRCAFVQLVLEEAPLPISGRSFGFGDLMSAQASGDLLALRAAGKRVARLAPGDSPAGSLRRLAASVGP